MDRAAFDVALEHNIPIGGFCPKGRLAEDGTIPAKYEVRETPLAEYSQRTLWNVRDSEGTLVLTSQEIAGGTLLTINFARELGRPFLILSPKLASLPKLCAWLHESKVSVLNIAGPRESEEPGVYNESAAFLRAFLSS